MPLRLFSVKLHEAHTPLRAWAGDMREIATVRSLENKEKMQQRQGNLVFQKERARNFRSRRQAEINMVSESTVSIQYSLTRKDGSGSGFGSWKTVPAVPVPMSVSGKTVLTVPVSGSSSVPEPPCYYLCAEVKSPSFRGTRRVCCRIL